MSRPTTRWIATRRLLIAAALVLAVVTGTASAGRGDPQKHLTSADNARARSMLLKLADLGPGFTASPQSAADADDYCKALDESDLTVTGEAESPAFRRAVVSVSSAASVYESTADASASWRRSTSAAGERCAREILRSEFAKQGVTLVSFRRIPFPNVAERTAAYRLRLSAEMQGTTVPLVLDLVALRQARAQVSTFFTGLSAIPRSEQVLLARVVAERMARAMRGT